MCRTALLRSPRRAGLFSGGGSDFQDVVIRGVFPVLADEHLVHFLRVSTFHCRSLSTLQLGVEECTVQKLKGRMRIAMIGLLWFGVEEPRLRFRGFGFKLEVFRSFVYGAGGSSNPAGARSRLGPDPWSLSTKHFCVVMQARAQT